MLNALSKLQTCLLEYTDSEGETHPRLETRGNGFEIVATTHTSPNFLSPVKDFCDALDTVVHSLARATTTTEFLVLLQSSATSSSSTSLVTSSGRYNPPAGRIIPILGQFLLAPLTNPPTTDASFVDREKSMAQIYVVTMATIRKIVTMWCKRGDAGRCVEGLREAAVVKGLVGLLCAPSAPVAVRCNAAECLFVISVLCPGGGAQLLMECHGVMSIVQAIALESSMSSLDKNNPPGNSVAMHYMVAILERVSSTHAREVLQTGVLSILTPLLRWNTLTESDSSRPMEDIAAASALVLTHLLRHHGGGAEEIFSSSNHNNNNSRDDDFCGTVLPWICVSSDAACTAVCRLLTASLQNRACASTVWSQLRRHLDTFISSVWKVVSCTPLTTKGSPGGAVRATAALQLLRHFIREVPAGSYEMHRIGIRSFATSEFIAANSVVADAECVPLQVEFTLVVGAILCQSPPARITFTDILRSFSVVRQKVKRMVLEVMPMISSPYVQRWNMFLSMPSSSSSGGPSATRMWLNDPAAVHWNMTTLKPDRRALRCLFTTTASDCASYYPEDTMVAYTPIVVPSLSTDMEKLQGRLTLWLIHAAFHVSLKFMRHQQHTSSDRVPSRSLSPRGLSLSPPQQHQPGVTAGHSLQPHALGEAIGSSALDKSILLITQLARRYCAKTTTTTTTSSSNSRSTSVTKENNTHHCKRPHVNPWSPVKPHSSSRGNNHCDPHNPQSDKLRGWSLQCLREEDVFLIDISIEEVTVDSFKAQIEALERHVQQLRRSAATCPSAQLGRRALLQDLIQNVYPTIASMLLRCFKALEFFGEEKVRAVIRTLLLERKERMALFGNNILPVLKTALELVRR